MKRRRTIALAVVSAAFAASNSVSHAQIPVSNQMTISSGTCAGCDFSDRSIPRIILRDANVSGSLFNRSNLSGGEFYSSNMSNTHFRKAFLARVRGESVNLAKAELRDATLTEANLYRSIFIKADLKRADMVRGEFKLGNFSGADLTSATATGANFEGSHFVKSRFDHAALDEAVLDKAVFHGVQFGNASLANATMAEADFSGSDLSLTKGLTQEQLDTACGNAATELPEGLTVSYCENAEFEMDVSHDPHHAKMSRQKAQIASGIDRSIARIEALIEKTPPENAEYRKELQKTHAELMAVRRRVER